MNNNDLELKLLAGLPIAIESVGSLYPLTIRDIAEIGESNYNLITSFFLLSKSSMRFDGSDDISNYDLILAYYFQDPDFKRMMNFGFNLFFREDVCFSEEGFFYFKTKEGFRKITEEKWAEIQKVISLQNYIKESKEQEYKPVNEVASKYIEKLKSMKEKVRQHKKENGLSIGDIASIIAAYSPNLSIFDVLNLTVYQLYTKYIRLLMKDQYDSQFYLLPHTSDPKLIDLKHWATKLDN